MTALAESRRSRRPLLEVLAVELSMLLGAHLAVAQAPPSPAQPWAIPESAIRRAEALGDHGFAVPQKQYDLAALVDLAERENPKTREAWEAAREAAAAIGLAESAYLPQLSLQAIGGFQHTPLPMPRNLVPAGYFVSDTREIIPALALKWLLFDFGRRDAQLQAARADSFVANVAFTGAHQKLIFDVSQAYFSLGAARGKLHAAQKALSTALTTEDAAIAKQNNGLATVVAVAQAKRQTAQARYTLAAAEGAERTAHANLIAALGVPAATQIEVMDSTELPLPPAPADSVSKAVDQALAHRPDVIAALGKVDAAEAALKAALRSYRQGVGTYTDLATEENAVVQGDTQVEDARANAHTAAAALALSMGAIDIAGTGATP